MITDAKAAMGSSRPCHIVEFSRNVLRVCMRRYSENPASQLQLFGKTRFASFSILIGSLIRYRDVLEKAVKSKDYVLYAKKATRKGVWMPPDEDMPRDLADAERDLPEMEMGLFNTRAVPIDLIGTKKYATIFLDITSLRFWEALAVINPTSWYSSCFAYGTD
jgi:hypothetical protein